MAIDPKLATISGVRQSPTLNSLRSAGIDSELKSWVDNVIVPRLVAEFMEEHSKERTVLRVEVMAKCGTEKNLTEGEF